MVSPENRHESHGPVQIGRIFDAVLREIDPPSSDETTNPQDEAKYALIAFGQLMLNQQDGDYVSKVDLDDAWVRLETARRNLPRPETDDR